MLYRNASLNIQRIPGLISGIFLLVQLSVSANPVNENPAYSLEVSKSSQELVVKNGDQIIKRFNISVGRGGDGTKRKIGDNKTPIGTYKIVDFNEDSRFHFFMLINYPNQRDAWHGYIDNLINARQYKQIVTATQNNILPPQNTELGGYIGLHGIGEVTEDKLSIHNKGNWTEGCIALTNEEISELRKYVTIGTSIEIKE